MTSESLAHSAGASKCWSVAGRKRRSESMIWATPPRGTFRNSTTALAMVAATAFSTTSLLADEARRT